MALEDQKCEACSGESGRLASDEISKLIAQTPGWQVVDDRIERTFEFPNFVEAMKFANRITKVAEEENHHPDLHISWGKAKVELTTHKIKGLSRNDFVMAAKINRIWAEIQE